MLRDFANKFTGEDADPKLLEKLTTPEELSGLLNMCLFALTRLLDRGYFEGDDDWDSLKERWLLGSDSIHAFAEYKLRDNAEATIDNDPLYRAYCKYCGENGLTPKHKQTLTKELVIWKPNAETSKSGDKRYWRGIELRGAKHNGTGGTTPVYFRAISDSNGGEVLTTCPTGRAKNQ